ncbi:MAG: protein-L-isoaspartate O-methyltransferase family protein [Deltaproteobacteria bacterium]
MSSDLSLQRLNMVESQVRPSDVTDRRIPRAMNAVPREAFVAAARRSLAYLDIDLPVDTAGPASGRVMLAPRTFAKLLQLARIEPGDIVLDVGCATGYSAAILGRLAQTVVAVESDAGLAQEATRVLQTLGADNVAVVNGDLAAGYPSEGPFDAIVLEGAVASVPDALLGQLRDGGRLVAIVSDGRSGRAVVFQRTGETVSESDGFDAMAPFLPGLAPVQRFVF